MSLWARQDGLRQKEWQVREGDTSNEAQGRPRPKGDSEDAERQRHQGPGNRCGVRDRKPTQERSRDEERPNREASSQRKWSVHPTRRFFYC